MPKNKRWISRASRETKVSHPHCFCSKILTTATQETQQFRDLHSKLSLNIDILIEKLFWGVLWKNILFLNKKQTIHGQKRQEMEPMQVWIECERKPGHATYPPDC